MFLFAFNKINLNEPNCTPVILYMTTNVTPPPKKNNKNESHWLPNEILCSKMIYKIEMNSGYPTELCSFEAILTNLTPIKAQSTLKYLNDSKI